MLAILPLLLCLQSEMSLTTIRQFSHIIVACLRVTGRVTMLSLSRWAGDGGSYRTIQRFFSSCLPWPQLFWLFFRSHLFDPSDVYLLAGDETVVTKSGKHTHGLDRFFASLYGKPVPGLAFFTLSLISTKQRRSFPIVLEQVIRSAAQKKSPATQTTPEASTALPKRSGGRPKGSRTQNKTEPLLSPELTHIQHMLRSLVARIAGVIAPCYLVMDGHFGTNAAMQMVRQCHLHLITKLRCDSELYLVYQGPQAACGRRRKYGERFSFHAPPAHTLQNTSTQNQIETRIYQSEMLHKSFGTPINVVVIVKTHLITKRRAHVVLVTSDLSLGYETLIEYYGLRYQIEFNFRDAKQHWGLEDWMNVTEAAVTNSANLSLFLVNVSQRLVRDKRHEQADSSVLDLKAEYRGSKYVEEVIKLLPEKPEPVLFERILAKISQLGRIHAPLSFPISP